MKNEILLIPEKSDVERDAVAKAWEEMGGVVRRVGKFWIKPDVGDMEVSIYGYDVFCLVLAQTLNLQMTLVDDAMIARIPFQFLKRTIELVPISSLDAIAFPRFLKPKTPKLFEAKVFQSKSELLCITKGMGNSEYLLSSDIIEIEKEVRSFILDGKVQDLAYYEGDGDTREAKDFLESFIAYASTELPNTLVIDLGYNKLDGWFIIEFNASWGAGLNSCNPSKVVKCIREACKRK